MILEDICKSIEQLEELCGRPSRIIVSPKTAIEITAGLRDVIDGNALEKALFGIPLITDSTLPPEVNFIIETK